MPSLLILPFIQCHHARGLAASGGFINPFSSSLSGAWAGTLAFGTISRAATATIRIMAWRFTFIDGYLFLLGLDDLRSPRKIYHEEWITQYENQERRRLVSKRIQRHGGRQTGDIEDVPCHRPRVEPAEKIGRRFPSLEGNYMPVQPKSVIGRARVK